MAASSPLFSFLAALLLSTPMADCYAPEADDLHRRWLPREIFADIGIADPEPLAAVADPMPPVPAAAVEELAAQLAGMLGGGVGAGTGGMRKSPPKRALPPPPPPAAPAPAPFPPVCGLEGAVVMAYGGAAVAWPVPPYSPVQWQVASAFAGGVAPPLDYSMLPPSMAPPPCLVPPPPAGATKLRGGTGVFLPRAHAYRHAPPPAPKDGKAANSRTGRPVQQQQQQKEGEACAGKRQNWVPLQQQKASAAAEHACPEVALALPQDWSYH